MGKGNSCVHGPYEGLYFVDNDDLHVYAKCGDEQENVRLMGELSYEELTCGDWEYDEVSSWRRWEDTKLNFCEEMKLRFPSFRDCDAWIGRTDQRAILENELFWVAIEDNQWAMAVKLLQKEHDYHCLGGLQAKHFQKYLDGIRDSLFTMFEELGTYAGAWTSGRIMRPAGTH